MLLGLQAHQATAAIVDLVSLATVVNPAQKVTVVFLATVVYLATVENLVQAAVLV